MDNFIFQHPFTANVSGRTSCGKTRLIKEMLQKCSTMIYPAPQRIIYLYTRWQPLYDEILSTVHPRVKFVQGIPSNLDQDSFINPRVNNLIIIDDLMSLSSKDPRITELFTEGSHHRNLSVVAINQNLYYSKDPTQRRNCHYIILFNNPVDKQQVMTLGLQMYPEKPHHLGNHFNEAVSKPYGYLLVDLKPNTPEHSRLKPNIISNCISLPPPPSHQCSTEIPSVSNIGATLDHHSAQLFQPEQTCPENMNACRDCNTLFQDMHHLYRHKHIGIVKFVRNGCETKMTSLKTMPLKNLLSVLDGEMKRNLTKRSRPWSMMECVNQRQFVRLINNSFPKMQMPLLNLIETCYHSSLNYKTVRFIKIF